MLASLMLVVLCILAKWTRARLWCFCAQWNQAPAKNITRKITKGKFTEPEDKELDVTKVRLSGSLPVFLSLSVSVCLSVCLSLSLSPPPSLSLSLCPPPPLPSLSERRMRRLNGKNQKFRRTLERINIETKGGRDRRRKRRRKEWWWWWYWQWCRWW